MQYIDMNALQSDYADNLVILGFPCNQYWLQEPGASADEIYNGIKYVRPGGGFTPNFTLFKKIEVAGENQHPLYNYLTSNCPPTRNYFSPKDRLIYKPLMQQDVRWNWEKFLVGKDGRVMKRYDGGTRPKQLEDDVRGALGLPPLPPPEDHALSEPEPGVKVKKIPTKKFYPGTKGKFSLAKPGAKPE